MQIWTIANQKGGVAKTTTTVALGGLAAEQGQRVLLIDLDPHGSLTSYFGLDPDTLSNSAFVLFEKWNTLSVDLAAQLIMSTQFPNLTLLPSSTLLATLDRRAIDNKGLGLIIKKTIGFLADDFDLVIIDSPSSLGILLINALAACERLISPVQTEFLALKGLERMLHTLKMLEHSQKKTLNYVIVPTMYDRRTQASVSSLREIRHLYGADTWPGKIPVDTQLRNASKAGMPPHRYCADSRGVLAYTSLLKWLIQSQRLDQRPARYWEAS